MADIKLTRPAAGQNVVVPSAPDARMVLEFSADQVSIDRPQGSDSLFFRFDDGSSIELQDFYTQYNKDAIPSFEVDGQLIAGNDFFNAFGPDLAPAAGPAASPTRGARYSDLSNSGLEDGVNHLDGLDYRLSFNGDTEPTINPFPTITNSAPTLSTGGAPINMGITEAGVNQPHMAPITGSFTITDPDGDNITATVNLGSTSVAITGVTKIATDFGTLIITPSGGGANITYQFTYEVNDNPVDPLFKAADPRTDGSDSLAQGETHTEVITITLSDGMGHTVTQPINITVTGSNDAPDIRSFEDMTLKDDGQFEGKYGTEDKTDLINPKENTDTIEGAIFTDGKIDGTHHLLHAVGTITAFDPDHNAVLTYGIDNAGTFKDTSGQDTPAAYTVEKYTAPGNGLPAPTTVEGCDKQIHTDYGTLYLNSSTGKYEFVVDPKADATNHLAEGQSVTLSFLPTVTDEHGATDTQFGVMRNDGTPGGGANGINITIMGTNDAPVLQAPTWGESVDTVTEDSSSYVIGGSVTATDVDDPKADTLRYGLFHPASQGSESGTMVQNLYVVPTASDGNGTLHYTLSTTPPDNGNFYGTLTINPSTGSYSFTLNNGAACVQALDNDQDAGNSLDVTFPVVVKDDFGAFAKQNVSLTIKGVNDAPEFKTGDPASYAVTVKDAGVYAAGAASGTLNDAENHDTLAGGTGAGQHQVEASGKIVINDVDNGDNAHITWGVTAAGGDVPVGEKSTDLGTGAAKTFYVLDKDTVTTTAPTGEHSNEYYGILTVKDDGSYKFTANTALDSPVDKLGENAEYPITVKLYANDGLATTTSSLTITIKGSNEAPKVDMNSWTGHDSDNPLKATLTEAVDKDTSDKTVSGIFVAKDVDAGDSLHYGMVTPATTDHPVEGTTVYKTLYVVLGTDGKCQTVADGPKAGTHDPSTYVGEFNLTETGDSSAPTGSSYTFTLYNGTAAVQGLQHGDAPTASVTLVAQDDKGAYVTQTVSVTINGSNDTPTVGQPVATPMSVTESGVHNGNAGYDGVPHANAAANTFTVSDVDRGDTQTVSQIAVVALTKEGNADPDTYSSTAAVYDSAKGTYTIDTPEGTFTLTPGEHTSGASGTKTAYSYQYDLANTREATEKLSLGDTRTYTFTVTVKDSQGATVDEKINLTIVGTNDKPTLTLTSGTGNSGTATYSVEENDTVNGTFTVADVDSDGKSVDGNNHTDLANHKISLSLESGSSTDTHKAPTPAVTNAGSANGSLEGDASITTNYGVLTVKHDGTYSFAPNADFMDEGDQVTLNFKVMVTDRHDAYDTKNISVTLTGTNDTPHITTGSNSATLIESALVQKTVATDPINKYNNVTEGTASATSKFTVTDVDAHDNQHVSLYVDDILITWNSSNINVDKTTGVVTYTYKTDYGKLTITPSNCSVSTDGKVLTPTNAATGITYTYKYDLDNTALNSKNADFEKKYDFEIKVTDSHSASVSQNFDVTVKGADDIPLIGNSSINVTENGVAVGSNHTNSGSLSATTMLLSPAKNQNYDPDHAKADLTFGVRGLQSDPNVWTTMGKSAVTQYNTATTGTGTHAVTEQILGTYTATVGADVHSYVITNYGVLDINTKTGDYTFTLGTDADALKAALKLANTNMTDADAATKAAEICATVNALPQGEHFDLKFVATVTDTPLTRADDTAIAGTGGLTGAATITVTINGTNDQPQLILKDTSTVKIDEHGHANIIMTEDTNTPVTGEVTVNDPDLGDTKTFGVLQSTSSVATLLAGDSAPTAAGSVSNDYGKLSIDSKGNYTFTLDNGSKAVQSLGEGQTHTETFYVVVKDSQGAFDIKTVDVTITGKNDPTVFNTKWLAPDHAAIEKGVLPATKDISYEAQYKNDQSPVAATGVIGATDVDAKDQTALEDSSTNSALHYFITVAGGTAVDVNEGIKTGNGSLTINTAHGTLVFTALTAEDQKAYHDANSAAPAFKYTFTADDQNSDVNQLPFNKSLHDTFTVSVAPNSAATPTATSVVTLTINGTNDRPEISFATVDDPDHSIVKSVTEDTGTTSGTLTVSDQEQTGGTPVDLSHGADKGHFTFSLVSLATGTNGSDAKDPDGTGFDVKEQNFDLSSDSTIMVGTYGWMQIDEKTGEYTYTRTSNLNEWNTGEDVRDVFYVRVMDDHGAYSEIKALEVKLSGSNDVATGFTGTAAHAYEGGVAALAGAAPGYLKFTKADYLGANHATGGTMVSGTVHVADVDNDYTLAGKDTFALNLTGNNKVTFAGSSGVSVTNTYTVDGNTIHTAYGDFTLTTQGDDPNNPAGTYKFTPYDSGTIDALKPGQVVTITVPVKAFSSTSANGHDTTADGYPGSVTITLHGTNDAPVVGGTTLPEGDYTQSFTSSLSDTPAEKNTFSHVDTGSALRLTDDEIATWRTGEAKSLTVRGTLNDANIERDVDNTAQNGDHRYTELSFFGVKSDGSVTQNGSSGFSVGNPCQELAG